MENICVRVKTLKNNILEYHVEKTTKISELQSRIETDSSVSEARQRLIYRGRLLKSQESLIDIGFEDQHIIHLVIRPETSPSREPNPEPMSASAVPSLQTQALPFEEVRQPVEDLRNRLRPSDALRQNIMTIKTLNSRIGVINDDSSQPISIVLFLGQWVDALDSVGAWFEAIIADIRDDQVFIHYNGWANRWDEWIDKNSPRIGPLRSKSRSSNEILSLSSPSPSVLDDDVIRITRQTFDSENDDNDRLEVIRISLEMISNYSHLFTFTATATGREFAPILDRLGRLMSDVSVLTSSPSSMLSSSSTSPYERIIRQQNNRPEVHEQRSMNIFLYTYLGSALPRPNSNSNPPTDTSTAQQEEAVQQPTTTSMPQQGEGGSDNGNNGIGSMLSSLLAAMRRRSNSR